MKNIEKIFTLQERFAQFSPFFQECNDFYYHFATIDELEEVKHELLNQDFQKLEDEMGDVLWTLLNLISKLESRGYIDSGRMINRTCQKISERLPYVVEGRVEPDSKVRAKLWNEAKARQKERDKQHDV